MTPNIPADDVTFSLTSRASGNGLHENGRKHPIELACPDSQRKGITVKRLLMCLLLIVANSVNADEKFDEETLKADVAAMAKQTAKECEFMIGESKPTKLAQHPDPILRWSNPTAGRVFGEIYVWTDNGRPAVVGSFYRWFGDGWADTIEVCSLAKSPIVGRRERDEFWKPEASAIKFQLIKDTDAPAPTPAARLVQMRRLANAFVTQLADTRGDAIGTKRELRLLNQPVFRYPAPKGDATYFDGALFAFVEGTDPEVLLLIEAVTDNATPTWRFGLARMNRDALRVSFRDKEVWSVPYLDNPFNHARDPYSLFSVKPAAKP